MNINLIQNLFYYFSKQYKKNLLSTRKEVSKKMSSVMKSPLPNLDEDIHNNVFKMRTNENNRVHADRQIPLTMVDIMYEFLGNMSGFIRKWHYDESEKTLYMYHNDQGFSEQDEKAITEKNSSGNNSQTVGLNGHGFKVALDRVLSKIKRCMVVSMNTQRKCTIGHFDYTQWEHCDIQNEVASIFQKMEINEQDGGSLFVIPFNEEYHILYMKEQEMLRKKALLMLNIKISENRVQFYWNNILQNIEKICPDEGCVTLHVDFGYDSKSEILNENHKKTPLIRINNYEQLDDSIKTVLPSLYIVLGKNVITSCKIDYQFRSFENLTIFLNAVPSNINSVLNEKDKDGFLIYINDECIVHKPLIKGLKAQHGIEEKTYGGKPRFSIHISKTSNMYFIPTDKSNIKETTKGEHIQKFVHQFSTQYFTQRNSNNEIESEIYGDSDEDSDNDENSENNEIKTQDISPRSVSTETTSSTKSLPDIHSNLDINDDTMNENEDILNPRKKRNEFSTSTKDKAFLEYQNNKEYNGPDRCPCCDRILKRSHYHAGHIISDKCGGSNDLDNCLPICNRCNNNDTRSIPEMMAEEWGIDHDNTKRVERYLIRTNKQGKDIIQNKRRELLENQFISQT